MKVKLKSIARQIELIGRVLRGLKYSQVAGLLERSGTEAVTVTISTN